AESGPAASPPRSAPCRIPGATLGRGSVTFLVFLAAAAGAWIVAADLGPAHYLLGAIRAVAAEMQFGQFPLLLALDIAREVLHAALGSLALLLGRIGTRRLFLRFLLFLLVLRIGHGRGRSARHLQE